MKSAVILTLAGAFIAASLPATAAEPSYGKRLTTPGAVRASTSGSFDVYIDGPTRFAFVNTPKGWKFTRQLSERQFAQLAGPGEYSVAAAR